MSAARVEADWIPRRGPDQCPPEYRPWLDAVAVAWDTPVQRILVAVASGRRPTID